MKTPVENNDILAHKKGYTLTTGHAKVYYTMNYGLNADNLSVKEREELRTNLIKVFEKKPKKTLKRIEEHVTLNPQFAHFLEEVSFAPSEGTGTGPSRPNSNGPGQGNFQYGFKAFQEAMDYNDLSIFESAAANELREYFKNSMLRYENVGTYSSGEFYGNNTYIEVIRFCGDGTFTFQSNSGVSVGGGGASGIDHDGSTIQGVWETFTQQGNAFLALYSQDPQMLKVNPKGFLPMLLKSVDTDVVRIANDPKDKLYRKSTISCGNY